MNTLAPWHQYAHEAAAAGRAEAAVQEKLRPIVLRIKNLKKETDADHEDQIAALERKAEAMRAELRQLPMRVSRYVWLACERHLRDLEHGHARGLYFDEKAATARVKFFSLLTHNKGKWAGKPLTLEPWQQFYIASLFGWKRADGTRRFREAYLEVARKNGKSTVGSGVCLLLLVLDGEAGAEIYTAATKKEQARIVFGDAQNMVRKSPALGKKVKVQQHSIFVSSTLSKMVPMSSDSKTEDGLNQHGAIPRVVINHLHLVQVAGCPNFGLDELVIGHVAGGSNQVALVHPLSVGHRVLFSALIHLFFRHPKPAQHVKGAPVLGQNQHERRDIARLSQVQPAPGLAAG